MQAQGLAEEEWSWWARPVAVREARQLLARRVLVGLRGIRDLEGVRRARDGGLAIGAGTTLTTVSRHHEVRGPYAALATAAGAVS